MRKGINGVDRILTKAEYDGLREMVLKGARLELSGNLAAYVVNALDEYFDAQRKATMSTRDLVKEELGDVLSRNLGVEVRLKDTGHYLKVEVNVSYDGQIVSQDSDTIEKSDLTDNRTR